MPESAYWQGLQATVAPQRCMQKQERTTGEQSRSTQHTTGRPWRTDRTQEERKKRNTR
jgi:hypothetical protein